MQTKFITPFLALLLFTPLGAQKIEPTHKHVAYGAHKDMKLNFWKIDSKKPTPLLVHIHGGGWLGGKKNETSVSTQRHGYSYASIDYRLAGTELLPAAVHDAARAIQFLRTKAKEWNFDPKRIAVTGGSAGAASSLWLAYHDDLADPKSKDPVLRQSSRVCGAVAMGGQTTLDPFLLKEKIGLACIRHPMIWKTVGATSHEHLMKDWDKYKALSLECSPLTHVIQGRPTRLDTIRQASSRARDKGRRHPPRRFRTPAEGKVRKSRHPMSHLGHRARATGNQQHRFPQAGLCKVGASGAHG